MKLITLLVLLLSSLASSANPQKKIHMQELKRHQILIKQHRQPSSLEKQRLEIINKKENCCSLHGEVNYCRDERIYCEDGWASACGC